MRLSLIVICILGIHYIHTHSPSPEFSPLAVATKVHALCEETSREITQKLGFVDERLEGYYVEDDSPLSLLWKKISLTTDREEF